jgi:hypothetical protein
MDAQGYLRVALGLVHLPVIVAALAGGLGGAFGSFSRSSFARLLGIFALFVLSLATLSVTVCVPKTSSVLIG